ncbi:MAG: hypothetical protein AAB726_03805 [Patescibacteria group bacterium]
MLFNIIETVALAIVVVLIPIILYRARENNQQATSVKEGTMKFKVAGGELVEIIPNVPGYVLVRDENGFDILMPEDKARAEGEEILRSGPIARWFQKKFGFWWVSIFYPAIKIHRFEIFKSRLTTGKKVAGDGAENRSILDVIEDEDEPSLVHELRWRFPMPVGIAGVESKDRLRIDILLLCTFQVIMPAIPIFIFNADFFKILRAAVSAAVINEVRSMHYTSRDDVEGFVDMKKGSGSPFILEIIRAVNEEGAVASPPVPGVPKAPEGIEQGLGIRMIDCRMENYALAEAKEILAATLALERARLEGEAAVQKSLKDLAVAKNKAEGDAARVKALVAEYGSPELASRQVWAEQHGSLTTIVNGGATALNIDGKDKKPLIPPTTP